MNILFCSSLSNPSIPHKMWEKEVQLASQYTDIYLLDESALQKNDWQTATRKLLKYSNDEQDVLYRGWMRTPEQYNNLYTACRKRGFNLINSCEQYLGCHHFKSWYETIKEHTPRSIIIESSNMRTMIDGVLGMNCDSVFVKDFVSSQKHYWKEACFIEDARNILNVANILNNFIYLQNNVDGIQGGLVAREYVQLKRIGEHPVTGMPLSQEFRTFVYKGKAILTSRYWEHGRYSIDLPNINLIETIAKKIYNLTNSQLFTIDTAQTKSGKWICIEVGDGQVSSLPENSDMVSFYKQLTKD